jgi:hypothetical protein
MKKILLVVAGAMAGLTAMLAVAEQDTTGIGFPTGYRTWYHHRTTVNLAGHAPEGNVGIQNVYANTQAVEGLKTGRFADGATFVVDRFKYAEDANHSLSQNARKVVAVMVRDAQRYPDTGGWGFQAFKGGDPKMLAVKDGGTACFACHIPHAENNFLFSRGIE